MQLPTEVLATCFEYLPIKDLCCARLVSIAWGGNDDGRGAVRETLLRLNGEVLFVFHGPPLVAALTLYIYLCGDQLQSLDVADVAVTGDVCG